MYPNTGFIIDMQRRKTSDTFTSMPSIPLNSLVKIVDQRNTTVDIFVSSMLPLVELAANTDRDRVVGSVIGTDGNSPRVQIGGVQDLLYTGDQPVEGSWLGLSTTPGKVVMVSSRSTAIGIALIGGAKRTTLVRTLMLAPFLS